MVEIANIAQGSIESSKAPEPRSVKVSVQKVSAAQKYGANAGPATDSISIEAPRVDIHIEAPDRSTPPINVVVDEANENLRLINSDLVIKIDQELKQVIFKVIDLATGETIKQIPSKEMIRVAKQLKHMIENYSNNNSSGLQLFMDSGSFA